MSWYTQDFNFDWKSFYSLSRTSTPPLLHIIDDILVWNSTQDIARGFRVSASTQFLFFASLSSAELPREIKALRIISRPSMWSSLGENLNWEMGGPHSSTERHLQKYRREEREERKTSYEHRWAELPSWFLLDNPWVWRHWGDRTTAVKMDGLPCYVCCCIVGIMLYLYLCSL